MKIVDITQFYNPKSGGVRRYIDSKVEYLKNQKDIQHVVIIPAQSDDEYEVGKSKFYTVKSPIVPFWKPYRLMINKDRVLEILQKEKPDIVEVGSPFILPKLVNQHKNQIGYKTIGFFHSNVEFSLKSIFKIQDGKIVDALRSYTYNTYSDFDVVICSSEMSKNYLLSLGINNIEMVKIGINTDIFFPQEKEYAKKMYNLPEDKIVMCYVGRLSKDKGIYDLIDIFNIVDRLSDGGFFLHLVGGGPDEKRLTKKLASLNYRITPFINNQYELAKIYSGADAFITCSRSDTYGISVLEAQSCGLPVFAYKNTSFEEITLYKDFLSKDKYEMIEKILNFKKNETVISRQDLHRFVSLNFSIEDNFNKLIKIYTQIVNKN